MSNRLELGGYYPSKGEQSYGELRARLWIDYSNALGSLIQEIAMNEGENNPREILAGVIAGEYEDYVESENEVNPNEYSREEWLEAQEELPEEVEVAADD